jgi:hypothetical protein
MLEGDGMDDSLTGEPFGFFTKDALRAGWYLVWRQLVRVIPVGIGAVVLGVVLGKLGLGIIGALVMGLGLCAAGIWAAILIPQLASRWAMATYGYPLTGSVRVWWGITWRVLVASLVTAVVLTPPNFVALSLSTSFAGSALGVLGGLLTVLLGLVNFVASILATGWAMSRVAVAQLAGLPLDAALLPAVPTLAAAAPPIAEPLEVARPAGVSMLAEPTQPVTTASAVIAPARPARAPAGAEGKRQCPKCSLYETERGTVIGWYCTICGWRESRR